LQETNKVHVLKCSHFYHSDCIQTWTLTSNTCPMCRIVL
jgi:hypothetical protein